MPGQRDQRQVELAVRGGLGQRAAAAGRPLQSVDGRASAGPARPDRGRRPVVERGAHGEPLEHVAQAEQLVDVAGRQLGHPHPAPRQVLDQTLLPEEPQRLPQRRPAGPEPAGELLLDQALARGEPRR